MSKLAFFFMTLVGAIPAGGALYALIMNILDRANSIGTVLLAVTITATVCTALVVLTPFIVLVFYKDTRLPMASLPPLPQQPQRKPTNRKALETPSRKISTKRNSQPQLLTVRMPSTMTWTPTTTMTSATTTRNTKSSTKTKNSRALSELIFQCSAGGPPRKRRPFRGQAHRNHKNGLAKATTAAGRPA